MNHEQTLSAIRTLLKIGGTVLVTKGKISADGLEQIVGAATVLIGFVLSYMTHSGIVTATPVVVTDPAPVVPVTPKSP